MKDLLNILTADIFQCIVNNKNIKINQLNVLINLLINTGKQFTLTFTPQAPTEVANALLVIDIQPNIALSITINFDSGTMLL